ncbi:secretory subunit [Phytophthora pseudosyringae]|uniref:Secretory subunit n=1 Tax=Phytophthora pseudosyringae TaxID=221518 RepID=A0A8T1WGD7_9STRA|nr:secretory subunit [Phytophthora pseudosyringae]
MLEYDNSAFYYFSVSLCALYAVPVTFLSLRRILYGVFLKDRLIDKSHVRCDRELRKLKQLQAEKTAFRNVFSLPFVFNLLVLVGVWYALVRMALLLKDDSEIKSFDPFAILGIAAGVSEREIKRAYRKMSLLYHPDKNQGDAVAEQKFMLVAKAYEALTDEVAKANYEKFGNPDGRQALQLSIGLPTFLLDPANHNLVLFLYLIILVVAIPSCVALWYSHSKKYGDSMIMYDTYGFYNFAMSQHSHPRMLPEILAGSAEFREIPRRSTDDAELGGLFKKFKQSDMMAKPKFNHPAIAKANLLLHAHFLREKLSPTLQGDLHAMLKKAIQLVDGMLEISVMKSWLQTTLNLMEMQQFLTQGLWFKDPPFLQLPHLTEAEVKHIVTGKNAVRSMHQYIAMKPEERKGLSGLSEEDRQEVTTVLDMMPHMELEISIGVEDEEFIAEGDIMTVTVKLTRKNVKEGDTCDLVYAPRFPYPKMERWYCVVGDTKMNHLHSFAKMTSQERVVEQKVQLQAPPKAGTYQLDIFVKSDSYVGMDLRAVAKFNVAPAATLPVYKPHPEDLELDNEPTLFEQVMNAADSSDSEEEDEDLEQEQEEAEKEAEESKKDK